MTMAKRGHVLIVFGGLPGTGKSTIARQVASPGMTYLRIDTIEQSVLKARPDLGDIGPLGYVVAVDVARDQLRMARSCVVDCVNPLLVTRALWRDLALEQGAALVEVETICSDPIEHRRRIESRVADIAGHRLPTWSDVLNRDYAPWDRERLVLDTAILSSDAAAGIVSAAARDVVGAP